MDFEEVVVGRREEIDEMGVRVARGGMRIKYWLDGM
jgi:hypothetical protein